MPELGVLSNVSRETIAKLEHYHDLLLHWTKSINLIAPSTAKLAWDRHINDSAQLYALIPPGVVSLADIGSGGGLPGLVLSILDADNTQNIRVTLIESDQRKAVFLRTVIRELELNASVVAKRIEQVTDLKVDVVTARALAPLSQLLEYASQLLVPSGSALFMKGRSVDAEIIAARSEWAFNLQSHRSQTDTEARVLEIKDICRAAK